MVTQQSTRLMVPVSVNISNNVNLSNNVDIFTAAFNYDKDLTLISTNFYYDLLSLNTFQRILYKDISVIINYYCSSLYCFEVYNMQFPSLKDKLDDINLMTPVGETTAYEGLSFTFASTLAYFKDIDTVLGLFRFSLYDLKQTIFETITNDYSQP